MGFASKHLPDKFYLEDDARISLRNTISREILVNTLMHREFTSTYIAKFVIENNRLYTENANRGASDNPITPDDFEPNPKNPLVAAFLRNIGLADELGSGVRKLFKYTRRYSGKDPELLDGDVFRTIVPLSDYSFDVEVDDNDTSEHIQSKTTKPLSKSERILIEKMVIDRVIANPKITQKEIIETSGLSKRIIQEVFSDLKMKGILQRKGPRNDSLWVFTEDKTEK
jgi:ATP-dependent DNA helicase RecG